MRLNQYLLIIACCVILNNFTYCQCEDVIIPDAGFEEDALAEANQDELLGFWYTFDGAELSNEFAFEGDFSACSNGGGVMQNVLVDSNTTYHVSCYVKNGMDDPWLQFVIQQIYQPEITVNTNDWTMISHTFNSGSDTIVNIGVYSNNTCFDNFQLTCESLVGIDEAFNDSEPFRIYPVPSRGSFTLELLDSYRVELYAVDGRLIQAISNHQRRTIQFGEDLLPSIYFVHVIGEGESWVKQIVKL